MLNPSRELRLIYAAQRGNRRAVQQLLEYYQDRLFTVVVHNVGCPSEARSIVEEAFLRAFENLEAYREGERFDTWLFRITMEVVSDHERPPWPLSPSPSAADIVDRRGEPASAAHRQIQIERTARLQRLLGKLDAPQRATLILREIEGFDYSTIASILGCGVDAVRIRLYRARSTLRYQLRLQNPQA